MLIFVENKFINYMQPYIDFVQPRFYRVAFFRQPVCMS